MVKSLLANAEDVGSIPGLGRSSGEGHGNPLWCSCLENPMVSGAWWAIVHGVTKSQMCLRTHTYTHMQDLESGSEIDVVFLQVNFPSKCGCVGNQFFCYSISRRLLKNIWLPRVSVAACGVSIALRGLFH